MLRMWPPRQPPPQLQEKNRDKRLQKNRWFHNNNSLRNMWQNQPRDQRLLFGRQLGKLPNMVENEEEQFYFLPDDDAEKEEKNLERKKRAGKKALGNDSPEMPVKESNNKKTNTGIDTIVFQTEIIRRTECKEQNNDPP